MKPKWICDWAFASCSPVDTLHRQMEKQLAPEHSPEQMNVHTLFRKAFRLESLPSDAKMFITADDFYKLYINGQFVGQGPAPAYPFRHPYNTYDVTPFLKQGKNAICVHVFYYGVINRVTNSADFRQGLWAELTVDGESLLTTDHTWRQSRALEFYANESIGYQTYFLEHMDFRLKNTQWKNPDYDDSNWKESFEQDDSGHILVPQETPVLSVYALPPETVRELNPGHFLIDFGREITGCITFAAQGKEGDTVITHYGEELDTPDSVRWQMRCNCNYEETLILSGGLDILENFDYKAFRYAEIIAPDGTIHAESIAAVIRHYPLDDKASLFDSSNQMLNSVWDICKNGVRCGSQEGYLDCPSREKGQYLGDLTVTAQSQLYLSGDLRLFRKSLLDFAETRRICPGLLAVAPGSEMQEIADFSLLWPFQLWIYYQHSGDVEFLREMLPVAEGILNWFRKHERKDGLLCDVIDKWNLVDWPDNLRDNYDFDLTVGKHYGCHNVLNAFYIGAVQMVETIRKELGIVLKKRSDALKSAYIAAFYNPATGLFTDNTTSQHSAFHSNVLPLFYHLAPDSSVPKLVEFIKNKRMCCGVFFSYFVLKGLSNAGEYELVYDFLTCTDEHSWGNMLSEDATSCFEAWGKEQKWNTSLCHPWASAPIPVLIEDIIGLTPSTPGWKNVRFDPHIPEELTDIRLSFQTISGTITFDRKNGRNNITLPEGCSLSHQ